MVVLIFLIVLGLVVWLIVALSRMAKADSKLQDAFIATHEGWDVYCSPFGAAGEISVVAIDRKTRRLAIGPLRDPIEVLWEDISDVSIERNGESLVQTNRGSQAMSAAVGAVLLGPLGLLVGGLTGSKKNVQLVNELALKVVIDQQAQPVHRVRFFMFGGKGVQPASSLLTKPAKQIEKFHALIANAIRAESNDRQLGGQPIREGASTVADQLEQLWQLRQSGALSEQEYGLAKATLLADKGSDPRLIGGAD